MSKPLNNLKRKGNINVPLCHNMLCILLNKFSLFITVSFDPGGCFNYDIKSDAGATKGAELLTSGELLMLPQSFG